MILYEKIKLWKKCCSLWTNCFGFEILSKKSKRIPKFAELFKLIIVFSLFTNAPRLTASNNLYRILAIWNCQYHIVDTWSAKEAVLSWWKVLTENIIKKSANFRMRNLACYQVEFKTRTEIYTKFKLANQITIWKINFCTFYTNNGNFFSPIAISWNDLMVNRVIPDRILYVPWNMACRRENNSKIFLKRLRLSHSVFGGFVWFLKVQKYQLTGFI